MYYLMIYVVILSRKYRTMRMETRLPSNWLLWLMGEPPQVESPLPFKVSSSCNLATGNGDAVDWLSICYYLLVVLVSLLNMSIILLVDLYPSNTLLWMNLLSIICVVVVADWVPSTGWALEDPVGVGLPSFPFISK